MTRRCFAWSAQYGRCDLDATHNGDHEVRHTFTDDEVWEPTVPARTTTGENDVPIVRIELDPDDDAACFLCGHPKSRHGPLYGCDCGDCKDWVPA